MLDSREYRKTAVGVGGDQLPLGRLYERFDAIATGRALERDGGSGRLRLIGVAPSAAVRSVVPDWTAGVAAAAR